MKKVMTGGMVVLMVVFLSAGLTLAGHAHGRYGDAVGDGDGPIHDIYAGTAFTYSGDVIDLVLGQGLLLSTSEGNVTIYGIGPERYWESVGVDRPSVGDTITVEGYTVDYNGELRDIATKITIGSYTVELRDADGVPLWR